MDHDGLMDERAHGADGEFQGNELSSRARIWIRSGIERSRGFLAGKRERLAESETLQKGKDAVHERLLSDYRREVDDALDAAASIVTAQQELIAGLEARIAALENDRRSAT